MHLLVTSITFDTFCSKKIAVKEVYKKFQKYINIEKVAISQTKLLTPLKVGVNWPLIQCFYVSLSLQIYNQLDKLDTITMTQRYMPIFIMLN